MVTTAARLSSMNLVVRSFSFPRREGGDVQHVQLDRSPSSGSRHPLGGGAVKVICCSSGDRSSVQPRGNHRYFLGNRTWPLVNDRDLSVFGIIK